MKYRYIGNSKRIVRNFAVVLFAVILSGCVYLVTDPKPFNKSLNYIPWDKLDSSGGHSVFIPPDTAAPQDVVDAQRGTGRVLSNALRTPAASLSSASHVSLLRSNTADTSGQELLLQPGMRITFAGFQGSDIGTAWNVVAQFQWIVPGDNLGPQDYFILSYVLTEGRITFAGNLPGCPDGNGGLIQPCIDPMGAFNINPSPRLALDILHSLGLAVLRTSPFSSDPGTASRVQEWLSGLDSFAQGTTNCGEPWQVTTAHVPFGKPNAGTSKPTDVELRIFDWNGSSFNDDPFPACADYGLNHWYVAFGTSVTRSRGFISVDVPIRERKESAHRYVPIYWSYADLERSLAVYPRRRSEYRVVGFRRNLDYLPSFPNVRDPSELRGSARYFTVWFSYTPLHHHNATRIFQATDSMKEQMLLAPGDVIYISQDDESWETDRETP
jgi:hypothetical protein